MKKENIDKLYQKELKDFSKVPDERVWKAISASLDKKEKRKRVIPLWWKLGGIAAVIAISLLFFNPQNENQISNQKITDTDNNSENSLRDSLNNNPAKDEDIIDTDVLTDSDTFENNNNSLKNSSEVKVANKQLVGTQKTNLPATTSNISENSDVVVPKNTLEKREALASTNKLENKTIGVEEGSEPQKSTAVLASRTTDEKKKSDLVNSSIDKESSVVTNTNSEDTNDNPAVTSDNKRSIFEEIEKSEDLALNEESNKGQWELGPTVGPVYFNSFGTGSPIHSNFVPNSKSGNINLSYGIGVAYQVGKKVKIRSGLNKVDYSYNTNDIAFSASLTASTNSQIDNINYIPTSQNLVVRNAEESRIIQQTTNVEIAAPSPTREGTMVQDFGYLELPLELNYAIIDKKFGFNVIGGFSSLFLVNNAVVLESGDGEMEMGEANNLNSVNLSTNFGLGFNYKFTSKIQLSLEPMFKYQLNTFSQTAGSFQPFSVGVFTGLNFKL